MRGGSEEVGKLFTNMTPAKEVVSIAVNLFANVSGWFFLTLLIFLPLQINKSRYNNILSNVLL